MQHPIKQTIGAAILSHIQSHETLGTPWPSEATHALVWNSSTWPCGWGKESCIAFFSSKEDLLKKIADHHAWARCEDNYVAYVAFEWDWGPVELPELSYNEGNVPFTRRF